MKTIINIIIITLLMCQTAASQNRNFYGTASGAQYGASATGIGDFNADGFDDFIVTSPNGNGAGNGKAEIFFGRSIFPALQPLPDITINGSIPGEQFGGFSAGNFDINDDGFKDVMISAELNNGIRGRVYVFFGRCDPAPYTISAVNNADLIFIGESAGNYFGHSVSRAGDFNGDCIDDIVIGAPYAASQAGKIYIISGIKDYPRSNTPKLISTVSGVKIFTGQFANALLGFSVSYMGDTDNDNMGDLIVGAPGQGGTVTGRAYIYFGFCASSPLMLTPLEFFGQSTSDDFGISVAGLGDINGNGSKDFVVGDWIFPGPSTGSAYVYDGNQIPLPSVFTPPALYSYTGPVSANSTGRFGNSTAGIGDFDGDSYNDFLIGGYYYAPTIPLDKAGQEYRFSGLSGAGFIIWNGVTASSYVGCSSSWAGDVNCDGRNDALWGGYGVINPSSVTSGAAYLDLSQSTTTSFATLNLTALIQGRYDASSNTQQQTEVKVCLYDELCHLVDEKIVTLDANGVAYDATGYGIKFNNLPPNTAAYINTKYYIVIEGVCNGIITTWSAIPIHMVPGGIYSYDFSTPANMAYGTDAQSIVDNSPLRYGIFIGDVNGDCTVDASDISAVENDAVIGASGGCCLKTDVSGDDYVDALDLSIIENNANYGPICQSPCTCPCL